MWSFLTPMLMLGAYTFVFSHVFKARWGILAEESAFDFALTLFAGLAVFNVFSEMLVRSPVLVLGQPNLVKKVVFPLETLPAAALVSAMVHGASGLALVVVSSVLTGRPPGWSMVTLPLIFAPLVCLSLGLGWFLASLGVFVRDTGPAVVIAAQLLIFLTPVFYPLQAVPDGWREVLLLNPLAVIVESTRRVLLWQQWPAWKSLAATGVVSILVLQGGYAWFMKSKKAFADVV